MVVYKNNPETEYFPDSADACFVVSVSVSSSYGLMPCGNLTARKFSHGNYLLAEIFDLSQRREWMATVSPKKEAKLLP